MTDYTRSQSDRLRAVTVAGEVANLIRRLQVQPDLFQGMQAMGIMGGTGGTLVCGLRFTPNPIIITIPSDDPGTDGTGASVLTTVSVTSTIAQTITFTIAFTGDVDPCLGPLTVTPGTYTFVGNDTIELDIVSPYDNCSVGSAAFSVTVKSSTGCEGKVLGTLEIVPTPMFLLEVYCSFAGGCSSQYWRSSVITDGNSTMLDFYGVCNLCSITSVRLRSLHGFDGWITASCSPSSNSCTPPGNPDPCTGCMVAGPVHLTADPPYTYVVGSNCPVYLVEPGNACKPNPITCRFVCGPLNGSFRFTATGGGQTRVANFIGRCYYTCGEIQ